MTNLFVYGTLKKSFHNHYILKDQELVGEAETCNKYIMLSKGIPYVYESSKAYCGEVGYTQKVVQGSCIKGEFYKVDDEALARIDQLEGHPRWYCRKQINVCVDICNHMGIHTSRITQAWIYFMKTERSIGGTRYNGYPWFTSNANIVDSFVK